MLSVLKGKQKEQEKKKQRTSSKMGDFNSITSVIISNVNVLNTSVKRLRLSEWIQQKKNQYMLLIRNSMHKHADR